MAYPPIIVIGEAPENQPPIAQFSWEINDLIVNFTDTSYDTDGYIVGASWDFGDGVTMEVPAYTNPPPHGYLNYSAYTVTLIVYDSLGLQSEPYTVDINLEEPSQPPIASFDYSVDDLTVYFTNISYDLDGDDLTFIWSFGDGDSSTSGNDTVVHEYSNVGTYTVSLTANDGQYMSIFMDEITTEAPNLVPEAGFTWSISDYQVTFSNTSNDPDSFNLSYSWNFGDDNTSDEENPIHIYESHGTYSVSLMVDDGEDTDTITQSVEVAYGDIRPQVDFTYTYDAAQLTYNFSSNSAFTEGAEASTVIWSYAPCDEVTAVGEPEDANEAWIGYLGWSVCEPLDNPPPPCETDDDCYPGDENADFRASAADISCNPMSIDPNYGCQAVFASSFLENGYPNVSWTFPAPDNEIVNYRIQHMIIDTDINTGFKQKNIEVGVMPDPSITITYPTDAGVEWNIGDTYDITWTAEGLFMDECAEENIRIQLINNYVSDLDFAVVDSIYFGEHFDNHYSYTVPEEGSGQTVDVDDDYMIRIYWACDPNVNDFSDNAFTISIIDFGACCSFDGSCEENVALNDCSNYIYNFHSGQSCSDVECPVIPTGACCHTISGTCEDNQPLFLCASAYHEFHENESCSQITCEQGDIGWRIISNSCMFPSSDEDGATHFQDVFPNAIDNTLYSFNYGSSGYNSQWNLEPARGYWVRLMYPEENFQWPGIDIENCLGYPDDTQLQEVTVDISTGWNMIGGPHTAIDVEQLWDMSEDTSGNQIYDLFIANTLFGFDGGYESRDELLPFEGYWIRASRNGVLRYPAVEGFGEDCGDYWLEEGFESIFPVIHLNPGPHSIVCDGGQDQAEVSWEIINLSNNTVLLNGGAPYSGTFTTEESVEAAVQMYDNYGDGWNGNILTICNISSADSILYMGAEPITGVIETTDDANWYSVNLYEDAYYTVETFQTGTLQDSIVCIYDADGYYNNTGIAGGHYCIEPGEVVPEMNNNWALDCNDDNGDGTMSKLNINMDWYFEGTYYIKVFAYGCGDEGSYSISIVEN